MSELRIAAVRLPAVDAALPANAPVRQSSVLRQAVEQLLTGRSIRLLPSGTQTPGLMARLRLLAEHLEILRVLSKQAAHGVDGSGRYAVIEAGRLEMGDTIDGDLPSGQSPPGPLLFECFPRPDPVLRSRIEAALHRFLRDQAIPAGPIIVLAHCNPPEAASASPKPAGSPLPAFEVPPGLLPEEVKFGNRLSTDEHHRLILIGEHDGPCEVRIDAWRGRRIGAGGQGSVNRLGADKVVKTFISLSPAAARRQHDLLLRLHDAGIQVTLSQGPIQMGRFWGLVFDYGDVNTKDFVPAYACRRPKPADPLFLNSFVLHSLEQRWQEMQAAGLIPNDPQALVIDNQALVTDPLELLEFEPHTIPLKYLEEFAGHAIRIGWSNMAAGEKAEGRALKDGVHTFYALSAIPPADVARHGELGLDSFQPYATPIQARQTHAWTAYEQRALEPAWLYAVEDTYRTGHPVSWPSVHSVRQINAFGYDIAEGCAVGVRKVVRAGEGINADDE